MSQPFFTYILKCRDGLYYTGHTDDLEMRIAQHHSGFFPNCFTYNRRPLELIWSSEFPSRIEALEAERKIKGWSRKKKEALIASDWVTVSLLASRAKVPRVLRDAAEPLLRTNGGLADD